MKDYQRQPISIPQCNQAPILWLATGFGTGLSPIAPGTMGTLVGVVFAIIAAVPGVYAYVGITALVCWVGVSICARAADHLGVHDHSGIVWDEIAGYMVAMLFVPITVTNLIVAFVLFRIADIAKPWPIGRIDRTVTGGIGIMLDDIVAGLVAGLAVAVVDRWVLSSLA